MRYVTGLLFGTAAAAHTSALANVLGTGCLVGAGVVAMLFAIEAIVLGVIRSEANSRPPARPTRCGTPLTRDEELRRLFDQPSHKDR